MKNKKKDLDYYLNLNFPVTLEVQEESGKPFFDLQIPDLPGVWGRGATLDEAYNDLLDSKKMWFDIRLQEGMDIPEPITEDDFSGRFVLRLDPQTHMKLTKEARRKNISLNQIVKSFIDERLNGSKYDSEISMLREIITKQTQQLEEIDNNYKKMEATIKDLSSRISEKHTKSETHSGIHITFVENDLGWSQQQDSHTFCNTKDGMIHSKKPVAFHNNLFGKITNK